MDTAQITYTGELRTEAVHLNSGRSITTDAPLDNKGRGEAFSPTDLLATSLPCCMITTMGILAEGHGIELKGVKASLVKHMGSGPRRVVRIEVHLEMDGGTLNEEDRGLMERTARTCPVALSLHPDVVQDLTITYQ